MVLTWTFVTFVYKSEDLKKINKIYLIRYVLHTKYKLQIQGNVHVYVLHPFICFSHHFKLKNETQNMVYIYCD